jgi:hypothetical protein
MTEESDNQDQHGEEEEEEEEELYANSLEKIERAQQEREQKFPKIEALRRSFKAEFEDVDDDRIDTTYLRIVIDLYTRRIEESLAPDEEDPVDPAEWLEFGYEERESVHERFGVDEETDGE